MIEDLNDQELLRYSRQIMLPSFDYAGQLALRNAHVLIVGAGGLGCPAAQYLSAAGVGSLSIADDDVVELSNLQRQILHYEADVGKSKVESVCENLRALNSNVALYPIKQRLEGELLLEQVRKANVVLDCSDSFSTRFAVNQACVQSSKPLVSGAAIRMEGQVTVFDLRDPQSACYECLYSKSDNEELNCSTSGVMAPLVGIIGAMQAMEAIKIISSLGQPAAGRLLLLDAMHMDWRSLKLKKDSQCSVCN